VLILFAFSVGSVVLSRWSFMWQKCKNPAARGYRGFLFERVPAIKPATARGSICWVVYSKYRIFMQWIYLQTSACFPSLE
jgi:hypothetical protein